MTSEQVQVNCLGLDVCFPSTLTILRQIKNSKHACCRLPLSDEIGLICFSNNIYAHRFVDSIEKGSYALQDMTFDQARDLAKRKDEPHLSALVLADDILNMLIHYIR